MRKLGLVMVAVLGTLVGASAAEARRGGAIWMDSEELHLVAPTTVSNGTGGQMALCSLSTKSHIFGLGFWRRMDGYALSYDACTSNSYIPLEPARLARMQAMGELPAALPPAPGMNRAQLISGFTGTGLVLLFIAGFGLVRLLRYASRARRRRAMTGANGFGRRLLDVMCHAAKADGQIDPEEIDLISAASRRLTGAAYPAEQIEKLIAMARVRLSDDEFRSFGNGLNADQREMLMRGALMVTISDGHISAPEKGFLARLAAALGISGLEMQGMLRSL